MPLIPLLSHWEKSWDRIYQVHWWGFTVNSVASGQEEKMSQVNGSQRRRHSEYWRLPIHEGLREALKSHVWHSIMALDAGHRGPAAFPPHRVWFPCAFPIGIILPLRLHCRNMLFWSNGWNLSPSWSQCLLFGKLLVTPSKHKQAVRGNSVPWI